MKTRTIIIAFLSILLLGCSNYKNNTFCDHGLVLVDVPPSQVLKGVEIIKGTALYGSDGLQLTQDYLVVSFSDREDIFSVFDFEGKCLMNFGQMGHSANEFLTCQLNKQYWGNSFAVNDVNAGQLKVIDIEKTFANQATYFNKRIKTGSYSTNALILPSGAFLFIQQIEDNFKLILKINEEAKMEKDLFKPDSNPFPTYHCISCINQEGTILAFPMVYLNQVNFYDLSSNRKYSVSLYDAPVDYDKNDSHIYYCSVCTDGKYVYALYMNQSLEDTFSQFKKSEIHQFDFMGNLIQTYSCDEYLMDIDVDRNGFLYGLGCNEILYKYEI